MELSRQDVDFAKKPSYFLRSSLTRSVNTFVDKNDQIRNLQKSQKKTAVSKIRS